MRLTYRYLVALLFSCLVFAALFAPLSMAETAETPKDQNPPSDAAAVEKLVEIPTPQLEHLEQAVSQQLRQAHRMIEAVTHTEAASRQQRGQAYGELGQMYHAYELNDAAEASYRNALALDPQNFKWNYSLAYLLQGMGRYSEALAFYQRALNVRSPFSLVHVRMGECYRYLNQPLQAKEALETALNLNPGDPAIQARLGEIALEERNYEAAVQLLTSALRNQPDANKLHYSLAMAYRGLKDMKQARLHLAKRGIVGLQPHDPLKNRLAQLITGYRVHLLSGRLAYGAGRYAEAAEEFKKAVDADPEQPAARINLGTCLGHLRRYRDAVAQFREALRLAPDNITARFNLGAMLAHLGDYDSAIDQLRIVVKAQPNDARAHLILAEVLRSERRFGEAFSQYKTALKLDTGLTTAWLAISNMLINADQYEEGLQVLEEAHQRMPHNGLIVHALARLLVALPKPELRDGQRAKDLATKVYQAVQTYEHAGTLAMAYAEIDDCDGAAKWQELAIEMAADIPGTEAQLIFMNRTLKRYRNRRPCGFPIPSPPSDQKKSEKDALK